MADDSQILWVGGEFIEMAQGPLSLREKWTNKRNAAMKKVQGNSEVGGVSAFVEKYRSTVFS